MVEQLKNTNLKMESFFSQTLKEGKKFLNPPMAKL